MDLKTVKQSLIAWSDRHKKGILIAMVLVLFISLVSLVTSMCVKKSDKPLPNDRFKKLKETTEKVKKTTTIHYTQALDVNEMYKKANVLAQKDSLTKEDYGYLKMVDSTFKSIMKPTVK